MKTVWRFLPPSAQEKLSGKHPTQKPVALLERIISASTIPGDFVFDPFSGSSTTGVAAQRTDRRFCGCEKEMEFITMSKGRLQND
jgi:site-specific DNA-methyltransferase (adenine-specific)